MGIAIVAGLAVPALRVAFWIGLALVSAYSLASSVSLVVAVVALLAIWNAFSGRGRLTLQACVDAMADGARQALPVGLACAVVGIVIGTMTLTGLGTIIGTWMISIGKDNMFLALVLTMIFSLILGMGIPTIPNYIITSSLAAPILLNLDVPLIVSHMFVFYFGIMADLTPPVALAAFAAAPMAKVSGMKIGVQAIKIALPGFIVPYMAVYDPALMLQPVAGLAGASYWLAVAYVLVKACLALGLWGVAAVGYFQTPLAWWERLWAAAAAALLVLAVPATDEIGFVLALAFIGFHVWRTRQARIAGRSRMICLLAGSKIAPLLAGAIPWRGPIRWKRPVGKRIGGRSPAGLELVEARVQGSGAGMEPPPGRSPDRGHVALAARPFASAGNRDAAIGRDGGLAGLRRQDDAGRWTITCRRMRIRHHEALRAIKAAWVIGSTLVHRRQTTLIT